MARDSVHVYVLHIHHRHGDDYSVYTTEAAAKAAMAKYCREWWGEVMNDDDPDEVAFNDEQIILAYMEREQLGRCEEWYEVDRCVIEGAVESLATLNVVINIIRSLGLYLAGCVTSDGNDVIRLGVIQRRIAQTEREILGSLSVAQKALPWLGSILVDHPSATGCNPKTPATSRKRALDLSD